MWEPWRKASQWRVPGFWVLPSPAPRLLGCSPAAAMETVSMLLTVLSMPPFRSPWNMSFLTPVFHVGRECPWQRTKEASPRLPDDGPWVCKRVAGAMAGVPVQSSQSHRQQVVIFSIFYMHNHVICKLWCYHLFLLSLFSSSDFIALVLSSSSMLEAV